MLITNVEAAEKQINASQGDERWRTLRSRGQKLVWNPELNSSNIVINE